MGRIKDLTGQRFGRLVVIRKDGKDNSGHIKWLCKCDCGNEISVSGDSLRGNKTKSCGCYNKERTSEASIKDLTGMKFNRLTVIKENGRDKHGKVRWLCKCECGNEITVDGASLTSGNTKSCGCFKKERITQCNNERWDDKDFKQRISDMGKERWNNEELKERYREMMIDRWQDEEYRASMVGENNPNYNPNLTNEEREQGRHIDGYKEWVYEVKERANFTCDCCGDNRGGNLVSHHLDGYHWNKEGRIDINNGVCLCEKCHKEFHHIYGNKNNTKEQYIEFKENK